MALSKSEKEILRQAAEIIRAYTADNGDTIKITGFGTFRRKLRPARTARNPLTGAAVHVPEKSVLKFTPAKVAAED